MGKGPETRHRILELALEQACTDGLSQLHLQPLAQRAGLSKSGLYAHFDSRDALLAAVLDRAGSRFRSVVLLPPTSGEHGLNRLAGIFHRWIDWPGNAGLPGACLYCRAIAAPAALGDAAATLLAHQFREFAGLIQAMAAAAMPGPTPVALSATQFVHEWFALRFAHHWAHDFLGDAGARSRAEAGLQSLLRRAAPRADQRP